MSTGSSPPQGIRSRNVISGRHRTAGANLRASYEKTPEFPWRNRETQPNYEAASLSLSARNGQGHRNSKTLVYVQGHFAPTTSNDVFTLPAIKASAETLPSVPKLPSQQAVTGDKELDTLLWLHTVICIG